MAAADQIKALIKSFSEQDESRFYTTALQIAAKEAKKGHKNVAREIKELIDEAQKKRQNLDSPSKKPTPISRPGGELSDLLEVYYPQTKLSDMVLKEEVKNSLKRVLKEQHKISVLKQNNLDARRKLMLLGNPGCGKTMTAEALAGELDLPILIVRMDGLITKFMGESIAKLRLIFDEMNHNRGVYLFDEFDSIGINRSYDNEVGEMKRILNSFLINIEKDNSNSLIIAASNRPKALDTALHRRFDDIIRYDLPNDIQITDLIKKRLAHISNIQNLNYKTIIKSARGHSHAEIARACNEAIKDMILNNKDFVDGNFISEYLNLRH